MKKIRMIGFDLDGTLLSTKKKISDYTKRVLEDAHKKGIEILPVTGRPFTALPEDIKKLSYVRYAVTSNGARIVEMPSGKPVYEKLLPIEKARKILDILKEYDTLREIYYDGRGYNERCKREQIERYASSPESAEYTLTTRFEIESIEEKIEEENRDMDKVQGLFIHPQEKEAAWEQLLELDGIQVTGALANNIEVNAENVHKGNAILWLGKRLGIDPEEMLMFGDGANDIQMLQTAGIGAAVENAVPAVKEAADVIVGSNDEDGVAEYIETYIL